MVAPNVHVTCPPMPTTTLLGVKASPDDVFTFPWVGRLPLTVTATEAVLFTDPSVSETLIVEEPACQPVTSPELLTSATVVVVEPNVGEPGFEMTWPCV